VDQIFRYGGEEFVVILPETNVEDAICLADRMREKIMENEVHIHDKVISITASFGVSGIKPDCLHEMLTGYELVDCADKFLYRCKKNGRNQVDGGYFGQDSINNSHRADP